MSNGAIMACGEPALIAVLATRTRIALVRAIEVGQAANGAFRAVVGAAGEVVRDGQHRERRGRHVRAERAAEGHCILDLYPDSVAGARFGEEGVVEEL